MLQSLQLMDGWQAGRVDVRFGHAAPVPHTAAAHIDQAAFIRKWCTKDACHSVDTGLIFALHQSAMAGSGMISSFRASSADLASASTSARRRARSCERCSIGEPPRGTLSGCENAGESIGEAAQELSPPPVIATLKGNSLNSQRSMCILSCVVLLLI